MGFERYLSEDLHFEVTIISDDVNDNNMREHIHELNKSTAHFDDLKELADCRNITSFETITIAGTIKNAELEAKRPNSLLAVLVSEDLLMFGMARSYQQFSKERRKDCRIFKSMNEALLWLAGDKLQLAAQFELFYSDYELTRKGE